MLFNLSDSMACLLMDSVAILQAMTKLEVYFSGERGRAAALAKATGASAAFLRAIARGERPCPVKLAVKIETCTHELVKRQDLFEKDWQEYWPELIASNV